MSEDDLQNVEGPYRLLFERNPQPMWVQDRETQVILAVNDAAIQQYGYSREEFLRMKIQDMYPPEGTPAFIESISSKTDSQIQVGKWHHRKKDGNLIEVHLVSQDLDFAGRPAVLMILHNVTESRQAEEELYRVNRVLLAISECGQALVRSTQQQKLLIDICQIIVEQGGYALAWVGFAQYDEAKTILPVARAGAASKLLDHFQFSWADNLFGQDPAGIAVRTGKLAINRHSPGGRRRKAAQRKGFWEYPASIALPLIHNENILGVLNIYAMESDAFGPEEVRFLIKLGDQLGFGIASLQDRAASERAKEALLKSEELLRNAFDNAPIGMALVHFDNRILEVNRALCDILGYSREALIATTLEALTHPDDRGIELEHKFRIIAGLNQIFQIEKRYLHADGHVVWGQLSVSLVTDVNGRPMYYLSQVEDITRRKQALESLQESEYRYRSLFMAAQRQAQELALLDKVRTALAREIDLPILFRTVVEAIAGTFGYTLVSLYLCENDSLVLQHQVGHQNTIARIVMGADVASQVTRSGKPMILEDAHTDLTFADPVKGIQSEVCVPLFDQGIVVGVLKVESVQGEILTRADLRLMTALSEHVSIAIGRARLFSHMSESEERYARAVEGANDGLWDWDLNTGLVYYSPRWKSMLHYAAHEISSSIEAWFGRVHPDDMDHVRLGMTAHLEGISPNFENEHRILDREGRYRWVLCRGVAVRDIHGTAQRIAGSMTDITLRKQAEERLLYDALHDALTGLPNRALFLDRLHHVIQNVLRYPDHHYAVLFLDLDHFKMVNDSLGHSSGDELLIMIAERLKSCLRPGDTVARLGGDEFVLLLENIETVAEAALVAERIQIQFAPPFKINGQDVFTAASVGIVWGTPEYRHPGEVLRDADIAMYRAKAMGKACYQVFDTHMRDNVVSRLELEAALRRALEQQELRVYYHPIMSLTSNRLLGIEALVRWESLEKGLIHPKDFIPMAEESSLIVPIDRWVLRESCSHMAEWTAQYIQEPPLVLNVNLSSKQFTRPDLINYVQGVLTATGLNERSLKVEITESVIMADMEYAVAVLTQLHGMGIQICIDDFGTGYSSLSYLFQLPVDTLKIDRSFIERLEQGESAEIVHTIVELAHNLGMDVIAEGVETEAQWSLLHDLGCDAGQGFLIALPMSNLDLEAFLRSYFKK
jgi:diguanylate cyclase (GGDEF)-like protein/PAS domain S-box-containing protein